MANRFASPYKIRQLIQKVRGSGYEKCAIEQLCVTIECTLPQSISENSRSGFKTCSKCSFKAPNSVKKCPNCFNVIASATTTAARTHRKRRAAKRRRSEPAPATTPPSPPKLADNDCRCCGQCVDEHAVNGNNEKVGHRLQCGHIYHVRCLKMLARVKLHCGCEDHLPMEQRLKSRIPQEFV